MSDQTLPDGQKYLPATRAHQGQADPKKVADFIGPKTANTRFRPESGRSLGFPKTGIVLPAHVMAAELGTPVRRAAAPIGREGGLWRLEFPDGSVSDVANRSWVMDAARALGLIDRKRENVGRTHPDAEFEFPEEFWLAVAKKYANGSTTAGGCALSGGGIT